MENIQNWIMATSGALIAGYLLKRGYVYLKTKFPEYWKAKVRKAIEEAYAMGDTGDTFFVLGLTLAVEHKMLVMFPEGGRGEEKYALVAKALLDKLSPRVPLLLRPFLSIDNEEVRKIIEVNVAEMKTLLAKSVAEHVTADFLAALYFKMAQTEQVKFQGIINA